MINNFICRSIFIFLVTVVLATPIYAADNANTDVKIIPKEIAQGDAVLVKVSCAKPLKGIQGKWQGKTIDFYREQDGDAFLSLLGIDLDASPGKKRFVLNITNAEGNVSQLPVAFSVLNKDFPVQRLTLPPNKVFLSPETLARAMQEKTAVQRIWDLPIKQKKWKSSFVMPVQGLVLCPFGGRRIINNAPRSPHSGIDLRAKAGTPVLASSDGIIVMTSDHFFAGKSVFIDHGMGIVTMYFHLSEIHVKKGEKVAKEQIIGLVGMTGRATGPHLHWGVRIQGSRVDPLSLIGIFN